MEHCRLLKLFAALALALALAACDTPSNAGVATLDKGQKAQADDASESKDAEAELQKWTECMRENGIDIPDASMDNDGGIRFERKVEAGDDDVPSGGPEVKLSEDFQKAHEACGEPPRIPGAGPSKKDLKELQENALKLAQCMRDEGIEDFPDPDFSGEGPGAGPGTRVVVGEPFGGDIDMNDPDVQAAFEKCAKETGGDGPLVVRGAPAKRVAD